MAMVRTPRARRLLERAERIGRRAAGRDARSGSRRRRGRHRRPRCAACAASSSGPPGRSWKRGGAAGEQDDDAVAGDAVGAGKFERVGQRHQAGTAGRGIGEPAAAGQAVGGDLGRCGDLGYGAAGRLRRLRSGHRRESARTAAGGCMSSPSACSCTASVRNCAIRFSPHRATIPKKYHLSSGVNEFLRRRCSSMAESQVNSIKYALTFAAMRN